MNSNTTGTRTLTLPKVQCLNLSSEGTFLPDQGVRVVFGCIEGSWDSMVTGGLGGKQKTKQMDLI